LLRGTLFRVRSTPKSVHGKPFSGKPFQEAEPPEKPSGKKHPGVTVRGRIVPSPEKPSGKKHPGVKEGRPSDNSSLCFIIITNALFVNGNSSIF
jgi:hypothetical protein